MSQYPGKIDTSADLTAVSDGISEINATTINSIIEAILAIQQTLGEDPQGIMGSVNERITQILNADGTFNSDALTGSGLIALPIDNSMIADSAAIKESKLDLVYPTPALQSQIDSANIDLQAIQNLYNSLSLALTSHASGLTLRHDGYHINLSSGLAGEPTVTTVGRALDFIHAELRHHTGGLTLPAHSAEHISYDPAENNLIQGETVQDAIDEIDTTFQAERAKHNRVAHSDGVVLRDESQTSSGSAALIPSVYRTNVGQEQLKVGHINSASVKTRNINIAGLTSSSQSLEFEVKCGTSTRTLVISGLNTYSFPVAKNISSIDALIHKLNSEFATVANHFPLQAYRSHDNQIVIQHNISRSDCTVKVKSPALNSAVGVFGLADVDGLEVTLDSDSAEFYLLGVPKKDLAVRYSGTVTLGAATSLLNLGEIVGSTGLELKVGELLHIFNHTTPTGSGTYIIAGVGSPPSTQVNLATTVPAGTFDCIIYSDTSNLAESPSPRAFDIVVDSDLNIIEEPRLNITLFPITGIDVLSISPGFEVGNGELTLITGTPNQIQLVINAKTGPITTFNSGYVGYINVYGPNNTDFIKCLVTLEALTSTTSIITTVAPSGNLRLGSSYFNSALRIQSPEISVRAGSVSGKDIIALTRDQLGPTNDLSINSGVVRGCATSISAATEILLSGGTVMSGGIISEFAGQTVSTAEKASANGIYNLVIVNGNYVDIYNSTLAGYSVDDLALNSNTICVAQFTVLSGTITLLRDSRIFVGNKGVTELGTVGDEGSSFRTLEAALLYGRLSKIEVLKDLTTSANLVAQEGKVITVSGNLTCADLTLGENTKVIVHGELTAEILTLGSGSKLEVLSASIGGDITLQTNSEFRFNNTVYASGELTLNEGSIVRSAGGELLGTVFIVIAGQNAEIVGVTITVPSLYNNSIINIGSITGGCTIRDCTIQRGPPPSTWGVSLWGISCAAAATIEYINILNTKFINLHTAVRLRGATDIDRIVILNSEVSGCRFGVDIGQSERVTVLESSFSEIAETYINLDNIESRDMVLIEGCTFGVKSALGTGRAITAQEDTATLIIRNSRFNGIVATNDVVSAANVETVLIAGCVFSNCSTDTTGSNFTVDIALTGTGKAMLSGNLISNALGSVLRSVGGDVNVGGNILASSDFAAAIYNAVVLNSAGGQAGSNIFALSTRQLVVLTGVTSSSNKIICGRIGLSDGAILSNNFIVTTRGDAFNGIEVSGSGNVGINNNILFNYNTNATIRTVASGVLVIQNNIITPTSGFHGEIMRIEGGPGRTYISGNQLVNTSAVVTNIIYIGKNNTSILGNTFITDGASPSVSAINIAGTHDNIYIADNIFGNNTPEAYNIIGASNASFGRNKNYRRLQGLSAVGGQAYNISSGALGGQWEMDTGATENRLRSSTVNAALIVPLNGLWIGEAIENISIRFTTTVPGSFTFALFKRVPGTDSVQVGSTHTSGTSPGTAGGNYTPGEVVAASTEYFIRIVASATDVRIGNITVQIKE